MGPPGLLGLIPLFITHTTPHLTTPHQITPYHSIPYLPYHTTPYHAMPYHTTPHHITRFHMVPTRSHMVPTRSHMFPTRSNTQWHAMTPPQFRGPSTPSPPPPLPYTHISTHHHPPLHPKGRQNQIPQSRRADKTIRRADKTRSHNPEGRTQPPTIIHPYTRRADKTRFHNPEGRTQPDSTNPKGRQNQLHPSSPTTTHPYTHPYR
jgi:hypothetical protein